MKVDVLRRASVYQGFYQLSVIHLRHQLYSGKWSRPIHRELFHRGQCVAVLPYDPVRQEVLLVEQFRIGALGHREPPWLTEIIAGGVEPDEQPEAVARREGQEEAGVAFTRLHSLGTFFTSPGGTSERATLYVGEVEGPLRAGFHGLAAEDEDIRTRVVSLKDAERLVEAGEIDSLIPAYAILWCRRHLESGGFA